MAIMLCVAAKATTTIDTQIVTAAVTTGTGEAEESWTQTGYQSGVQGSISDGTSNVYGGASITAVIHYGDSLGDSYVTLTITGAANSGWEQMYVGSAVFNRTAASYTSGTWTWYADNPFVVGANTVLFTN